MPCPLAANDNGNVRDVPTAAPPARAPDDLGARVLRLQAEAQRANLDALAFILAMAAREAHRVAAWERQVLDELGARSERARQAAD